MSERIINPEKIGELAKALALARVQFPDIPKNKTVKVSKQGVFQYEFNFADLACIFNATKQALSDNGLAVIQQPTGVDGKFVIETILVHESGTAIISHHPLPDYLQVKSKTELNAAMQSTGSAESFARRYAVLAILGIAAQDDDDANISDGNDYQQRDRGNNQGGNNQPDDPPETLESLKGKYFASAAFIFVDDDDRHKFQAKVSDLDSSSKWSIEQYDKALEMFNGLTSTEMQHDEISRLAKLVGYPELDQRFMNQVATIIKSTVDSIQGLTALQAAKVIYRLKIKTEDK